MLYKLMFLRNQTMEVGPWKRPSSMIQLSVPWCKPALNLKILKNMIKTLMKSLYSTKEKLPKHYAAVT
jgi:hypothetical protein